MGAVGGFLLFPHITISSVRSSLLESLVPLQVLKSLYRYSRQACNNEICICNFFISLRLFNGEVEVLELVRKRGQSKLGKVRYYAISSLMTMVQNFTCEFDIFCIKIESYGCKGPLLLSLPYDFFS